MTRPIEQQRAACARFRGWRLEQRTNSLGAKGKDNRYWVWCRLKGDQSLEMCRGDNYHPDTILQHAAGLKERLRELEYGYGVVWTPWLKQWDFSIYLEDSEVETESTISEEAALTAAVAELQERLEKESPADEWNARPTKLE